MMYYLHHLSSHFIGFNVFLYVTFRAIAAAVTAFLTTLIFGNFIIAKLRALKVEQPIRGAAEVHRLAELQGVKQGTPTMGGVLVIARRRCVEHPLGASRQQVRLARVIQHGLPRRARIRR